MTERLLRVARNVSDLPRLTAFYREALGFVPGAATQVFGVQVQRMRLGEQEIELVEAVGLPYPRGGSGADPWFQHIAVVTTGIDAAAARVLQHGAVSISDGVQHLPPQAGNVAAFKFRDPDGHPLELIQFPPGSPWDTGATALTLGFDHSAISVLDTEASIAFYTGLLGFTLGARQVNHGPAQDRMDGMDGVHVDVVALTPARQDTPHVELLGYHRPGPAASWDPGATVADRLVLQLGDIDRTAAALSAAGHPPFAHGPAGFLVRDPSGHILQCVSEGTA